MNKKCNQFFVYLVSIPEIIYFSRYNYWKNVQSTVHIISIIKLFASFLFNP